MLSQNHQAYFRAFGLYRAQLRKLRGFTQTELAGAIGVSQRSIIAYERSVSILIMWRLAQFFEMAMDDLAGMINDVLVRKRRLPPSLVRQVKLMQLLTKKDRRLVTNLIASMLTRSPYNAGAEVPTPTGGDS